VPVADGQAAHDAGAGHRGVHDRDDVGQLALKDTERPRRGRGKGGRTWLSGRPRPLAQRGAERYL